jgi:hypothetical protein
MTLENLVPVAFLASAQLRLETTPSAALLGGVVTSDRRQVPAAALRGVQPERLMSAPKVNDYAKLKLWLMLMLPRDDQSDRE